MVALRALSRIQSNSWCRMKYLEVDVRSPIAKYLLNISLLIWILSFCHLLQKFNAIYYSKPKLIKKYLHLGGSGSELRLTPSWEFQDPLKQIYLCFPSSTYPFKHRNFIGHHSFQWVVTLMFCAILQQFWASAKPYPFAILRVQILQPSKSQSPVIEGNWFSVDQ